MKKKTTNFHKGDMNIIPVVWSQYKCVVRQTATKNRFDEHLIQALSQQETCEHRTCP